MNLLYMCVFHNESYIRLLKLLITSIQVKAKIDARTTDILIVTSAEFRPLIQAALSEYDLPIQYYIPQRELRSLFDAGCARLHIFDYEHIEKYDKILYMDTDILINGDMNTLFNLETDSDKIYALEEGYLNHPYWGSQFFDFTRHNPSTTAFTSGIMYFHRNDTMKALFQDILDHIQDWIYVKQNTIPECLDQPFIVYNAVQQGKYNNQLLKAYVENNPSVIRPEMILYHFPGTPGKFSSKYDKMTFQWNMMNKISHVLFQTNKQPNEPYVTEMIRAALSSDWTYEFYGDEDVLLFFKEHPIPDLPDIISRYNALAKGAHKADLFRYYYLYLKGGFFMDSDAMIYTNIANVVRDYNFVSVDSSCHPGSIFQGILGAAPRNELIKQALYNAYNTTPECLIRDYHYWCRDLYRIVKADTVGYDIKLYRELRKDNTGDEILDDNNNVIFKHYWCSKVIPEKISIKYTDWNNYNKDEINDFDYRVLTTYKIPNTLIRVGPNTDGGYVIADGFNYDVLLSCGISDDNRFEEAFLDKYPIQCYAFDGTIHQFPPHRNNMVWVKKNVGSTNTDTITNLKEYLSDKSDIFLKMDIEGSEFNWIDSMTTSELNKISQIVMEVHWPFDKYRFKMLQKLNETHLIIHIHGNNYCDRDIPKHLPSGRSYDGTVKIQHKSLREIVLPEVFEITYIRRSLIKSEEIYAKEIMNPTHLDAPNNPYANDIYFSIPIEKSMTNRLINRSYTWGNSQITFLENNKMSAFGEGHYSHITPNRINASFGDRVHEITFNDDFSRFISVRKGDNDTIKGIQVM